MNRILVTGANGFVGTVLCKRLVSDGWVVSGTVRSGKAARITFGVKAVEIGNIDASTDWNPALQNIDTVVHLAARVHIMTDKVDDPLSIYREVNVHGTENLARQAVKAGVQRFVFLSSVKVNGDETRQPYIETDQPSPVDAYGISKMEAEKKLLRIATEVGLEVVILRPPLTYGPGVKANFLRLLQTIDRGTPLPLAGIRNKRSLIYIENLVDAIVSCVAHTDAAGETYLVSDGEDISTPELIRMISSVLDKSPRLFRVPEVLLYITSRIVGKGQIVDRLIGSLTVDAAKFKEDLGWHPPFTLKEGLEKTVAWYRDSEKPNQ